MHAQPEDDGEAVTAEWRSGEPIHDLAQGRERPPVVEFFIRRACTQEEC